jgi:hypothetical protein
MGEIASEPRFIASGNGSVAVKLDDVAFEPRPGFKRVHVMLGDEHDEGAPQVYWAKDPPDITWDAQSHGADFVMFYLEGSQKVGDTWYGAGDVRVVKAGTVYGPITAGPEGSTVLLVFASANYKPKFEGDHPDETGSPYHDHVREADE